MNNKMNFVQIIFFYPLSLIYSFVVYIRNRLFDYNFLKSKEFTIPIISVGNITVGGTGKTPHIEYLISILKNECKIAVLSRGYKRKSRGFVLAHPDSTYYEIGDEPKQIKTKFPKLDVAVNANRTQGIYQLLEKGSPELNTILLDDAYQHRYVKPGLSILLVDYTQPMFHDHFLPYGRLRENRHEKRRSNIIIITKTPRDLKPIDRRILVKNLKLFPYQNLFFTTMAFGDFQAVFDSEKFQLKILECVENKYSILAISGIANPQQFDKHIQTVSNDVVTLTYPDHHNFTKKDANKIYSSFNKINNPKKIIVTTEKDAMRFQDNRHSKILSDLPFYYIPMQIEFLNKETESFNNQIINYVRKNKRNSNLHKEYHKK